MALNASAHCVLVTPSGNNDETEKGRLLIVQNEQQHTRSYRGVVEHVGAHIVEEIEVGNVLHYTTYFELLDKHVVPDTAMLAFEDDE